VALFLCVLLPLLAAQAWHGARWPGRAALAALLLLVLWGEGQRTWMNRRSYEGTYHEETAGLIRWLRAEGIADRAVMADFAVGPALKAYCGAELMGHTLHNLYTLRGAKVRDSLRWATYLDQALEQTADAEVFFAQHNWPIWGRARIAEFITKHRDVYKYTHDQTVRLINAGYTPREIADRIKLPRSLETYLASRGYYGDLRHNVKAVYQFYMGFYDGNPAHLNPLPPEESARRYIALIGGADRAIAAAQDAFDKGDYRWTAELLNQVVFAEPGNRPAARLLARTYDQMGYMSEAATWRNSYLTAAAELLVPKSMPMILAI